MAYSDSLMFDYDINSDFIVIQSCLRDEQHNELIQNSKSFTLLDDHLTFNLGDSFDSFEGLQARMEAHSKQSNVHYWMRDSRTIQGARMKTTRRIEPRLKYYNVKYACVYGGNKFYSKSQGKRNSMTMKLDCPAHVTLRANRAGEQLDVISVCNHHNHPISPHIYSRLRQERRLHPQLKEEVFDLLRLNVVKKRIMEYVRWKSGKILLYRDVINMMAAVKGSAKPTQQRKDFLLDSLKKMEVKHRRCSADNKEETECIGPQTKKKRSMVTKNKKGYIKRKTKIKEEKTESPSLAAVNDQQDAKTIKTEENQHHEHGLEDEQTVSVGTEVEIHYKQEGPHSLTHSNILKYLYQTDCDGEPVTAILNEDQQMVSIDQIDEPNIQYNFISSGEGLEHDQELNTSEIINFEQHTAFQDFTDSQSIANGEVIPHIITEATDQMLSGIFEESESQHSNEENYEIVNGKFEEISPQEIYIGDNVEYVMNADDNAQVMNENKIILEQTWISEDNVTYVNRETIEVSSIAAENVEITEVDRCNNCDKIKLDLNTEVNMLRTEKRELIEETNRLRRERDSLTQEVRTLKGTECRMGDPSRVPLLMKTVKGKNKLYLVKI